MRINAAFCVLQDLIPKVHRANQPCRNFHCCGNAVETPPVPAGLCLSGVSGTKLWQRAPASQYLLSCRVLRAAETRGGILPKRDAGSKRKLSEYHAHAPQIIHSFSTGENSKYFSCITEIFAMRIAEIAEQTPRIPERKFRVKFARRSAPALIRYCRLAFYGGPWEGTTAPGGLDRQASLSKRVNSYTPRELDATIRRSGSTRMALTRKGAPSGVAMKYSPR